MHFDFYTSRSRCMKTHSWLRLLDTGECSPLKIYVTRFHHQTWTYHIENDGGLLVFDTALNKLETRTNNLLFDEIWWNKMWVDLAVYDYFFHRRLVMWSVADTPIYSFTLCWVGQAVATCHLTIRGVGTTNKFTTCIYRHTIELALWWSWRKYSITKQIYSVITCALSFWQINKVGTEALSICPIL